MSLLLLIFYICLILYYYWTGYEKEEKIILKNITENKQSLFQNCQSNEECLPDQICFQNKCIPKLRSGDECDHLTGYWSIIKRENEYFVACMCKYPNIITQNFVGSNCDVDLACAPYGKIIGLPNNIQCLCAYGYKSVKTNLNKPACVKMSFVEMAEFESGPCNEDEIDTTSNEMNAIIDSNYLKNQFSPKCIKRPCTFDALTGKPLKRARFEKNWGCVCDPRYGNIGVNIDHPNYLQNIFGYNACINIFGVEPLHDIKNVKLYSYFYVFDKRPISFIQYTDLKNPAPLFKSFKNLQIEETWPYSIMQYILKHADFIKEPCKNIPLRLKKDNSYYCDSFKVNYDILFGQFPFCSVDLSDSKYYGGWMISNPFELTLKSQITKGAYTSNGIVMFPDPNLVNKWIVKYAPYVQDFIDSANEPLIPNFNDKVKYKPFLNRNEKRTSVSEEEEEETEVAKDYSRDLPD